MTDPVEQLKALDEVWKPIPDYEDKYEASNQGRIRNAKNKKVLKDFYNGKYNQICLYRDGKDKKHQIHRLVASAFMGKSTKHVHHKNENKTDNRLSNLQYMDDRENITDYQMRRKSLPIGVNFTPNTKPYEAKITEKRQGYYLGLYSTPEEASRAYQAALSTIKKHPNSYPERLREIKNMSFSEEITNG